MDENGAVQRKDISVLAKTDYVIGRDGNFGPEAVAHLYILENDLHTKPFALAHNVYVKDRSLVSQSMSELADEMIDKSRSNDCYKLVLTSPYEQKHVHHACRAMKSNDRAVFHEQGILFRLAFDGAPEHGSLPPGTKFFIEDDGKEVARARLYFLGSPDKPFGFMEDVFVDEAYRSKGYGKKVLAALIDEAKQNTGELIATSRHGRDMVHGLYRRLGFQDYGLEFRIDF